MNQHQAIKLLQSLREEKPELDAHLRVGAFTIVQI